MSGVGVDGVDCPPRAQFGGGWRQQSPHGQRRHQQRLHQPRAAGGKAAGPGPGEAKPDPWLAGTAPSCTTALAMSRDKGRLATLSFGCPNLDEAFQGGVRIQGITEIAGEAGAGKTQLCLQLLLQAQLAVEAGGLGGKSYVLTCGEGDFPSRRLSQMATSFQTRHGVRPEKLMEGVCIQNAKNLDDQMMIIMEHLPIIMRSNNVKLVVIDSIAALFRSDMGRGRGQRYPGAICTVTAKFGSTATGGSGGAQRDGGDNVPAMGLLWSQCINARFMVRRRDYRLSLQPWSNSYPRDHRASSPPLAAGRGGGQQQHPPPRDSSSLNSSDSVGGSGFGNGVGSAIAREIALEMSPCVPVHASCGFIIEREGVRGVGR
eukprot:g13478.t1